MTQLANRIERGPFIRCDNREDACLKHVYWQSNCDACRQRMLRSLGVGEE